MQSILEVKNIFKSFSNKLVVDDVSFRVPEGSCFGLLGPNGAGKSTTIEMIEQIKKPDKGQILFKGVAINKGCLQFMGVQFQETALPHFLTAREALQTFADLYHSSLEITELIKLCRIEEFQNQQHNKISGGQRQRLLLAVALCNDPDLLLLDEPTTGLDPQARRHLWEIIKNIKHDGKSIILTTHYMDEAQELCDTIGIMDHGKIMVIGKPQDLLKRYLDSVIIKIPGANLPINNKTVKSYEVLKKTPLTIKTKKINNTIQELLLDNIDMTGIEIRQSNLEDLFLTLTGEGLRS